MREHRSYSEELKSEAIKLVLEQGLSRAEAAKRLSIPRATISTWVDIVKSGVHFANPGEQSLAEIRAENAKLRRELAEARMERDILKKATAYFAKESLPGTRG